MSGIESDSEDLESVEGGGGEGEQEVAGSSGPEEVGCRGDCAGDVSSADGLRGAADQTFMLLCHGGEEAAARGGCE